ncbi:MAG: hypothetical protein M3340_06005 [Actinomycetota bacterium]|nr:hypothetical protein [Actinomycetota bacterium]
MAAGQQGGGRGPVAQIAGLRDLRRDLKAIVPAALKELREVNKSAAEIVAAAARRDATKGKTGRYSAGFRAASAGDKAVVRNPVVYANVRHWGGSTGRGFIKGHPWSGSVKVEGDFALEENAVALAERVLEMIADGVDEVLVRHGFK